MIARAEAKYVRISPRKVRMVIDCIKGLYVSKARAILKSTNKRAAALLEKVLRSAIANASNKGYKEDTLYIAKVIANSGPVLKRYRAASFGRAAMIRKRTSHILVELDTHQKILEPVKTKKGKGN